MRLGWNLNAGVIVVLIKWRGISFHSWKLLPCNHYIQEHWRIAIFVFVSTFLRPPVAKELHRALCLMFHVDWFHRIFFCILSISSIICFDTTAIRHKWTILDKANILKTLFLASKVKFLMHHILRTFWMFDITVK